MKTKEQIQKYNKEYFARPEVIARAKVRNAQRREKRREYKKTDRGKAAEYKYQNSELGKKTKNWNRIKNRYGITKLEFEKMEKKQNGVCAICFGKTKKLHIDHCHKTKKVRGILCARCNLALGLFGDQIKYLENAISYLTDAIHSNDIGKEDTRDERTS